MYYIYISAVLFTVTSIIFTFFSFASYIFFATRNPYSISTTKLASIGALLKELIPGQIEVIYIKVSDQFKNKVNLEFDECVLPDQEMFNNKCHMSLDPDIIIDVPYELPQYVPYGNGVGVNDVLNVPKTPLSDKPRVRMVKFSYKVKEWNADFEKDPDNFLDLHGNLRSSIPKRIKNEEL
jgi:hypothetical protein